MFFLDFLNIGYKRTSSLMQLKSRTSHVVAGMRSERILGSEWLLTKWF